jgi:hypothetical protein
MADAWGHPAAAIDTDQLYFNVDARFELAYDDARNAMVLSQAAELVISLFEHGWQTVIIFGNSLFDPDDTAPVLARLRPVAEVYHVTLVPALQAVLARCGTGLPGRGPSRLAEDAEIHARKRHPGSALLDNSALTPERTLAELARLVSMGAGRLSGLPDEGEGVAEVGRERVFGGEDVVSGADLDGSVAAGGADEFVDGPLPGRHPSARGPRTVTGLQRIRESSAMRDTWT